MSKLIDSAYRAYVNLSHREDRRMRMIQSLNAIGLTAERHAGILPKDYPSLPFYSKPERLQKMLQRTPGAVGCHFAQVSIMTKASLMCRHAFVMEDDLVFCKDFHRRMEIVDRFVEEREWDVIWLGGTFHVNPPYWHAKTLGRDAELTNHPNFLRTYGAFCTYAYIVNYSSITKILMMLDEELDNSIGIDYAFIQIQPKLQTFAFVPGCITQYDNKSDIGSGWTFFSHFAKLGPYWYQDRLENFDPTTYNWAEAAKC